MGSEDGNPGTPEERLERERERAEELGRITGLLRDVHRAAVDARTREELHRSVCERLVDSDPYVFAWLGEQDPATGELVALASHGREAGYLDAVDIPLADEDRRGPAIRAVESGEVQVAEDLETDSGFEPWREAALDRGYAAAAAIPVVYGGTVYGIVAVYADETGGFSERERAVLSELGETVGLAATAIERRRGLVADSVLEVDLAISDHEVVGVCDDTGTTLTLRGLLAESGTEFVYYYDVTGDVEAVAAAMLERIDRIQRTRVLGESRLEMATADSVLTGWLSDLGGTVVAADVDGERIRVTAEFPIDTDVRQVVGSLPYEMTVVAQRMTEPSAVTTDEFRDRVTERLTDRQLAALRSAYLAGYHDRPRTSTGDDIAETLGVSQSTFHQHHRVGVRKLLGAAFDRYGEDDVPD